MPDAPQEFVMRHPKLPGQPVVVRAWDEKELAAEDHPMVLAGWKVSKTKPEDVASAEPATEK